MYYETRHDDVVVHHRHRHKEEPYDRFSLPQKSVPDYHNHETIIRPPFTELEHVTDKYK